MQPLIYLFYFIYIARLIYFFLFTLPDCVIWTRCGAMKIQEIDELNEEIESCEHIMKTIHKERQMKLETTARQSRRSCTVPPAPSQAVRHGSVSVNPYIKTSTQERDRAVTANKRSKQHAEVTSRASPSGINLKSKKSNRDSNRVGVQQTSAHTLVASVNAPKYLHHLKKLEVPKQTNVNFELATKLSSASRHSNNIPLETKHLTWGHRLLEDSKGIIPQTRHHNNPRQECNHHPSICSKSRRPDVNVCRPISRFPPGHNETPNCSSSDQYDSVLVTPSESLGSYEMCAGERDLAKPSTSSLDHTAETSRHQAAMQKLSEDVTMINPVRLLSFLVKELGGKIASGEGSGAALGDPDTFQLVREIEHTLGRIPSSENRNASRLSAHRADNTTVGSTNRAVDTMARSPPRGSNTTVRSPPRAANATAISPSRPNNTTTTSHCTQSPPVRDTDSQIKVAAVLHRNLEVTWARTEGAIKKACEHMRYEKEQLQGQMELKKQMLDSAIDNEKLHKDTIEALQAKLEAESKQKDELTKTIAELSTINEQLCSENQVIPTLRANVARLGQRVEDSIKEKEKLTTQISNQKEEVENLTSMLEKKEADLLALKKGMLENHKEITDQISQMKLCRNELLGGLNVFLTSLGIEVQQDSNPDSCLSESSDTEREPRPVTSSPTSSASSQANDFDPSWQRISNITTHNERLDLLGADHLVSPASSIKNNSGEVMPIIGVNKNMSDTQVDATLSSQLFQSLGQPGSESSDASAMQQSLPSRQGQDEVFREIKKLSKFNVNARLPSPV